MMAKNYLNSHPLKIIALCEIIMLTFKFYYKIVDVNYGCFKFDIYCSYNYGIFFFALNGIESIIYIKYASIIYYSSRSIIFQSRQVKNTVTDFEHELKKKKIRFEYFYLNTQRII